MVRSFLALLLAAVIAFAPIPTSAKTRPLPSVQAIQYQDRTFCTVFSINEKMGYFGSAGHCALHVLHEGLHGQVTILGIPANIEMISLLFDVSVFKADVHIPALKLANKPVEPCYPRKIDSCEHISIQGFPYGLPRLITVTGHVAATLMPINHPTYNIVMYSDILDITTAKGNSGSPVMNEKGKVVGILWGGFRDSPHSVSIPLESIRQAMLGYFEGD